MSFFEPAGVTGLADLYCLPHAGGTAAAYRTWVAPLADVATVRPVQLPGREARLCEPAASSMPELVGALAPALSAEVARRGRPFALFGHSMGALVAYELARALPASGALAPSWLVVSGLVAPPLVGGREWLHAAPRDRLVTWLREQGVTPPQVLGNQALLDLFLPALRADLRLVETYQYRPRSPLSTDIDVLLGQTDPETDLRRAAVWADLTTGNTHLRVFAGDHFYLRDQRADLLDHLITRLTTAYAVPAGQPSRGGLS